MISDEPTGEFESTIEEDGDRDWFVFWRRGDASREVGPAWAKPGRFGTRLHRKDLEQLVTEGPKLLGGKAGESIVLNPLNLPTYDKLKTAIEQTVEKHPFGKMAGFRRFLVALTMLREMSAWLPGKHRLNAENNLRFLDRRAEELYELRKGVYEFLATFEGKQASSYTATEMMAFVGQLASRIMQAYGIDLSKGAEQW